MGVRSCRFEVKKEIPDSSHSSVGEPSAVRLNAIVQVRDLRPSAKCKTKAREWQLGGCFLWCSEGRVVRKGKPILWWTLRQLRSANPDVRKRAAENLGGSRDKRAVDPLVAALADPAGGVRSRAAEALGKIGDARAVEPLVSALKESGPEDSFLSGAQRQRRSERSVNARAVEPLGAALRDSGPGDSVRFVRRAAAEALGKIGDARAVKPLLVALTYAGGVEVFYETIRDALVEIDLDWARD